MIKELEIYMYNVPEKRKVRVIIDTDAKNEADDQFAIVHALLTPQFIIKGIITILTIALYWKTCSQNLR